MTHKLSEAQRRALASAKATGDPTSHLRGRSDWGGWTGTCSVLKRLGYLDTQWEITAAGLAAISSNVLPSPEVKNG